MYHKTSGMILFGQVRPKLRCLEEMYGTTFHLVPVVKHGGGGVMSWACFASPGPGHLVVIELTSV